MPGFPDIFGESRFFSGVFMAKKSVEKKVSEMESLSELVPAQDVPKTEGTEGKKIRIKTLLRGSYGAYNPGDTADLKADVADSLIKAGLAEEA